jgi:hypothetical protein
MPAIGNKKISIGQVTKERHMCKGKLGTKR